MADQPDTACGNGGQVIDPHIVLRDESNGPGQSADTPSRGQTAPPGPCA